MAPNTNASEVNFFHLSAKILNLPAILLPTFICSLDKVDSETGLDGEMAVSVLMICSVSC